MRISICILTYQRSDGLQRLLKGLSELTFYKNKGLEIRIVVIDNDPAGTGMDYCNKIAAGYRWPIQCYLETRRGISYARNTAIYYGKADSDFIAFIDDDEVPEPDWLDQLMDVQRAYYADVVSGPVLPYFHDSAPTWSIKGKFFERRRYPTGFPLHLAATGNVLIRSEIFEQMETIFDERFALTGGEDTHFFMRVKQKGYKMVWSNDAVVYEWVPQSRLKVKWLLQRAYRLGNTYSLCELDINPSLSRSLLRAIKALIRIAQGLLLVPFSLIRGPVFFVKSLQYMYTGAGMLAGMTGSRYEEYRNTHAAYVNHEK